MFAAVIRVLGREKRGGGGLGYFGRKMKHVTKFRRRAQNSQFYLH